MISLGELKFKAKMKKMKKGKNGNRQLFEKK